MIRLGKEVVIEDENTLEEETLAEPKQVNLFAQKVLKKMQQEDIAPTPYNFQIYFETMLEKSDESFKNGINSLRDIEINMSDEEHHLQVEKDMKDGFIVVKSMVQSITSIYKNIATLKGFIKKRGKEISSTQSQLTIVNIMSSFEGDLDKFDSVISHQLSTLKLGYEKAVESLKAIENRAIFDSKYDIYNKKYFLESIKNEKKSIKQQNHTSTIMALKVKKSILAKIKNNQDRVSLRKSIAKLLQKTSKRSDTVAHLDDGIFMMLMRHTDIEGAKSASQRVAALIYGSNFFVGGIDVRIDLEIAVTDITDNCTIEEILALLLNTLEQSSRDGKKYVVAHYSKEESE